MITVIGPNDSIDEKIGVTVNTTSRASGRSKGLSPFYIGPVSLYGGYISKNVENGWQFSKVYKEFLDSKENPKPDYFEWAKNGWNDSYAHRYPMGKGAKPEYSWWDGRKLSYIEARKEIYVPLYKQAVIDTDAFKWLYELQLHQNVYIWDFDSYKLAENETYETAINDPNRKFGHAFVLAMIIKEGFGVRNF